MKDIDEEIILSMKKQTALEIGHTLSIEAVFECNVVFDAMSF